MSQSVNNSTNLTLNGQVFQSELPYSVYSGGDSDIYTDFSNYQTLSNQDIMDKIESGENSGSVCLAKYPRCQRFYPIEEFTESFCSLFTNIDLLFGESGSRQIFDLINPSVLDINQKQTIHIGKSSSGKYYLIKSDHFHQTYSWEEIVLGEEFIQLYQNSSLKSKVDYAIKSIEEDKNQSIPIDAHILHNSKKLYRREVNFSQLDSIVKPNGFIEISYSGANGSNYVIWCDQNKMFGWYQIIESDDNDWMNAFV